MQNCCILLLRELNFKYKYLLEILNKVQMFSLKILITAVKSNKMSFISLFVIRIFSNYVFATKQNVKLIKTSNINMGVHGKAFFKKGLFLVNFTN